ncbi:MAG: tetratricopeptide repeat protein [Rhodothermales bacterium]|nr:tetratricopeptide repeat protein [Rhodothermales bacterium]
MSTLNPTRKVSRRQELREDRVVTMSARAIDFYENNRNLVYGAVAAIVVVALLAVGLAWNSARRNDQALERMATAVQRYEAGAYQAALDGDISFTGLLDIADEYGGTDAGNLAKFYAADALFRVGDLERSLEYFREFDKQSDYLGASAFAGEAAIHESRDEFSRAGDLFMRAANVFESEITSPDYLLQAGRAYERAGEFDNAISAYERIKEDYPDTQAATSVDFHLARLQAAS